MPSIHTTATDVTRRPHSENPPFGLKHRASRTSQHQPVAAVIKNQPLAQRELHARHGQGIRPGCIFQQASLLKLMTEAGIVK